MSIAKTTFLDKEAYVIENENFKATVLPSLGSNIISLYDKKKNVELLRTPKTLEEYMQRPMLYGTPVLFPPNRIEDATFVFNDKVYTLEMNRAKENNHIHGFVHNKEWEVLSYDENTYTMITVLDSQNYPEITQQFPHRFTLKMHMQLTSNGLIQKMIAENKSDERMPVGLGYHTTFSFPVSTSTLQVDIEKQWLLNERSLPTGELKEAEFKNELHKGMLLEGISLDDVYPMEDAKEAVLNLSSLGIKLTYKAQEGFLHWVLFTAGGTDNLVAVEPYSWVTNAPNLKLPHEVTGLKGIEAGEESVFVTEITVEHI